MSRKDWQTIKSTFHEALRLEPSERDSFLNKACGEDIDFRIEVESLLTSLSDAKSFLEQPLIGASGRRGSGWHLENGQAISHYRIISPIGSGGMGDVYLAQDQQLNRQVALKVLPEELLANRERLHRFQREAQIVSALNHPNILTIFEFGSEGDVHFLASEFVQGETLRARLRRGRLAVGEALDVATQIASALKAAHDAGVVHRDIKPDNLMIRDDGYVKVLDFGLAKPAPAANADNTAVTQRMLSRPGIIMGTATYMSPEQARGRATDGRSDIFSFGIVLFEALTGTVPFLGDTTADVVAAIIQAQPPHVSSINPAVPEDLDRVIAKCLEKDRTDRYQSAADLVSVLKRLTKKYESTTSLSENERHLTGQNTEIMGVRETRPDTSLRPPGKRRLVLAGMFTAIILGLLLASFYVEWPTSRQIDSIAVMPFVNESGNPDVEYLSDGMTDSLINALSNLPDLSVKSRNSVFRYKGTVIDEKKIGQDLSVEAILLGRFTQRGDDITLHLSLVDAKTGVSLWGEQYDRKIDDIAILQKEITRDVSRKLQTRLSAGDTRKLTSSYTENAEAFQLYQKGRFFWNRRTPESTRTSIEYFNQAIEKDPGFALAYSGLADAYVVPANRLAPREAMPKAKAAALRALEIDDTLAEAHTSLGRVLQVYDWNWKEAEKEFKRAIELNPRYAVAHQWYGGYLERIGRVEEGIAERKLALELDPLSTIINFELGQAYFFARDYDRSIEQLGKTLELDPHFPAALQYMPVVYAQKGMYDEAIARVLKAPDNVDFYLTGGPGYVYAAAGRTREARERLEELKRFRTQEYLTPVAIALIHVRLGETEEALAWLNKGYEERAFQMQYLKIDPRWDPIRNDPRFVDLVRRIGLPQ